MTNVDDILSDNNIAWTGEEIRKHLEAAGYVIVPKEPTKEMVDAAYETEDLKHGEPLHDGPEPIWHAMISAVNHARHPTSDGPG